MELTEAMGVAEELRQTQRRLEVRTQQLHAACRQRDEVMATLRSQPLTLAPQEARLLLDVAVKGPAAGRGDEFKALLQRLSDASGYEP